MYLEIAKGLKKKKLQEMGEEFEDNEGEPDFDTMDILAMLEEDDEYLFSDLKENEKGKARSVFIVKMCTVHDAWRMKKSKALA